MKTSLVPCLAVFLLATMGAARGQSVSVYKWTDASGTVHYTDQPPQGRGATRMTVKGGTEAATAPVVPQAASEAKLDAAETAATTRNCESARANLATLSSGSMLVDSTDPTASRRLRPDEIEAARRTAQADVDTYCGGGKK
ncbi:DUF4124 domain-containing protein [Luteibacter jiangsuensis]|uniref:DUF4124 domain-containing protein n=1 Tax=Luteibacter jiangsuensis TaxID=637577 RepID=A0ABX0Q084_9GAMM|nr:DUF4124 domain-containing protein [Luteibacter jiangsuensis]NID03940.1 DUF4124 domain-containing protein [Luteibacter jiangsuensis]